MVHLVEWKYVTLVSYKRNQPVKNYTRSIGSWDCAYHALYNSPVPGTWAFDLKML